MPGNSQFRRRPRAVQPNQPLQEDILMGQASSRNPTLPAYFYNVQFSPGNRGIGERIKDGMYDGTRLQIARDSSPELLRELYPDWDNFYQGQTGEINRIFGRSLGTAAGMVGGVIGAAGMGALKGAHREKRNRFARIDPETKNYMRSAETGEYILTHRPKFGELFNANVSGGIRGAIQGMKNLDINNLKDGAELIGDKRGISGIKNAFFWGLGHGTAAGADLGEVMRDENTPPSQSQIERRNRQNNERLMFQGN
jgi:hypothetical protein